MTVPLLDPFACSRDSTRNRLLALGEKEVFAVDAHTCAVHALEHDAQQLELGGDHAAVAKHPADAEHRVEARPRFRLGVVLRPRFYRLHRLEKSRALAVGLSQRELLHRLLRACCRRVMPFAPRLMATPSQGVDFPSPFSNSVVNELGNDGRRGVEGFRIVGSQRELTVVVKQRPGKVLRRRFRNRRRVQRLAVEGGGENLRLL